MFHVQKIRKKRIPGGRIRRCAYLINYGLQIHCKDTPPQPRGQSPNIGKMPFPLPISCAAAAQNSLTWCQRGPFPPPMPRSCPCTMAAETYLLAMPTASAIGWPRAMRAAIAEDRVQPVP